MNFIRQGLPPPAHKCITFNHYVFIVQSFVLDFDISVVCRGKYVYQALDRYYKVCFLFSSYCLLRGVKIFHFMFGNAAGN